MFLTLNEAASRKSIILSTKYFDPKKSTHLNEIYRPASTVSRHVAVDQYRTQ
jgi:hypothetical protein